jgi:hypothetical protein
MAAQIDHFDITCAPEFDGRAAIIGRSAENAYQRVASSLQHDLSFRPLLVLFATRAEQMRAVETRTVPGNREHVIVALDVPGAGSDDHLVHELSHVFLFDVLSPAFHRNVPVWILEGLAEHQRGAWEAGDAAMLRNMVETGTLPVLADVDTGRVETRRSAVFGHAAFDFLASRAGTSGARRFFTNLRANPGTTPQNAYLATLGVSKSDFDGAFAEYVRRRF